MGDRSGAAVARLVRRAFDHRNPLARGSDRLEGLLPASPVSAAVGAVVIALALWAALVVALCALVRWVNTRTSLRRWAAEWAAVGPEWTR